MSDKQQVAAALAQALPEMDVKEIADFFNTDVAGEVTLD